VSAFARPRGTTFPVHAASEALIPLFPAISARHVPCYVIGRRTFMEAFVVIIAAVSGVAVGVAAGRLFLEGVLTFAFRGRV
jgi:hypothetical protein